MDDAGTPSCAARVAWSAATAFSLFACASDVPGGSVIVNARVMMALPAACEGEHESDKLPDLEAATDADGDNDGDTDGEALVEGERVVLPDGDAATDADADTDGDDDGDTGEAVNDGDTEGDNDTVALVDVESVKGEAEREGDTDGVDGTVALVDIASDTVALTDGTAAQLMTRRTPFPPSGTYTFPAPSTATPKR